MIKNTIIALILSLAAVFFAKEIAYVLQYLVHAHSYTVNLMKEVFAGGKLGTLIRNTLALFLIPFIIALIPTLIYKLFLRKPFDYFPHVLWVSWLILATVLIVK